MPQGLPANWSGKQFMSVSSLLRTQSVPSPQSMLSSQQLSPSLRVQTGAEGVDVSQTLPSSQVPQRPPHPSLPQPFNGQLGAQKQLPATHNSASPQDPQLPPQPSPPHSFSSQEGVQSLH